MLDKDNVETAWGSAPKRLRIMQDLEREMVKIENIKYSFDLFRGFGTGKCSLVLNEPFKVVKREDGVIAIERILLKDLTRREKDIVRMIREMVPKITIKSHTIPWWKPWLWKYRKSRVPTIGLKLAVEIVRMVKGQLKLEMNMIEKTK